MYKKKKCGKRKTSSRKMTMSSKSMLKAGGTLIGIGVGAAVVGAGLSMLKD